MSPDGYLPEDKGQGLSKWKVPLPACSRLRSFHVFQSQHVSSYKMTESVLESDQYDNISFDFRRDRFVVHFK